MTDTVTLATNPKNKSQAFLGVALGTRDLKFPDLPVTRRVSTPDVGGPVGRPGLHPRDHGRA